MRKRVLWGIIVMLTGCILINGCGKAKETDRTDEKVVTIRFGYDANPIRKEQIALFEKTHPHINVKMDLVAGQKVLVSIAGGAPPDVFFLMDTDVLPIAMRNALEPLDDYMAADPEFNVNDYYPKVIDIYKYQGKQYALPGNVTPFVMYYNKKIFDEAGLDYPSGEWTWDDMLETAKNLTIKNAEERVTQFGLMIRTLVPADIEVFVRQNGGKYYNADGTKCLVNSLEVKEALLFVKDLSEKYHIAPRGSDMQSSSGVSFFNMGKAAMMISGRWQTIYLRKSKIAEDFRVTELFHGKRKATIMASMGWAIPRTSKHKKEAWELVKFLCQGEGLNFVIDSGDGMPPFIPLATSDRFLFDSKHPHEDNSVYIKALEYASCRAISPYAIEGMRLFNDEYQKFIMGQQGIDEALERAESKINKIIQENMKKMNE